MQTIHDLLMSMTAMLFAVAGLVVLHDLWAELESRRSMARGVHVGAPSPSRWKVSLALALAAWIPLLVALAMVVFTSGRVGVRTGETSTAQVKTVARAQAAAQPARVARQKTGH